MTEPVTRKGFYLNHHIKQLDTPIPTRRNQLVLMDLTPRNIKQPILRIEPIALLPQCPYN